MFLKTKVWFHFVATALIAAAREDKEHKKAQPPGAQSWRISISVLWESLGRVFPRKVSGSGMGLRYWGDAWGDQASADQMNPQHPHPTRGTGPDPSPAFSCRSSWCQTWQSCWCPLHVSQDFILLLCLFCGVEVGEHKGQRCFVSISLWPSWCLATLLSALSFALGKCLPPYHHPDTNLTSPSREEWKNLLMENLRSSVAVLCGEQGLKRVVSPI